jgi:hypothetical protein
MEAGGDSDEETPACADEGLICSTAVAERLLAEASASGPLRSDLELVADHAFHPAASPVAE